MVVRPPRAYRGGTSSTSRTNADFLAWFAEDERHPCTACGDRSRETVPDAFASFCLGCGAVWIDGERIDVDSRVAAEAPGRRWRSLVVPRLRGRPRSPRQPPRTS